MSILLTPDPSPHDPAAGRVGRAAPRGGPRGRAAGVSRLHLRPARRPRTASARASRRPSSPDASPPPLKRLNRWLSRDERRQGREGGDARSGGQPRRGEREGLHVAHLRHRARAGPRRRARKSHTVRFLDFENGPHGNEWVVTRQYKVLGSKKHVIPDIVTFVNGLPLAVIECKSPTIGDAWKAEAVKQLRRYQEADTRWKDQGAPRLFDTAQVLVGSCGEQRGLRDRRDAGAVLPGVEGAVSPERRSSLASGSARRSGARRRRRTCCSTGCWSRATCSTSYATSWRSRSTAAEDRPQADALPAVHRGERGDCGASGRRASRARGAASSGTRQGSGKSLTMLWLALKLRRDEAQQQPAVVIVTDRTKLDRQIAGVFTACGFPNPERADSVRGLRRILEHPTGRTVMTTIQKFQEITGAGGAAQRASGPPHAVRGRQHLRDGGRGPPHAVPEPRREHAAGPAQRLLPRLHRHPHRQEGPQHPADVRPLHRHLHHRAGGAGRGRRCRSSTRAGSPSCRSSGRPSTRSSTASSPTASEDESAAIKQRFATEQAIAGAPRRIEAVCLDLIEHFSNFIEPNRLQGPGGRGEPPRRGQLQGDAGPAERPRVGPRSCRRATTTRRGWRAGTCARTSRTRPSSGSRTSGDPAVDAGGLRHAAHRLRRAGRAGDVPRRAPQGAHPAAGHRPREPPPRRREDLRPRRRLLGRVREAARRPRGLLDDRRSGGAHPERRRAAAAREPARGGDEVLPAGRGHERPRCLRAGAGAGGCPGRAFDLAFRRFSQSMDMLLPGPARPRVSRRPALAGQDPRDRARPLPRRPARPVGLRREGAQADRRRRRRGRHPDPGQGGPALLARVRREGRRRSGPTTRRRARWSTPSATRSTCGSRRTRCSTSRCASGWRRSSSSGGRNGWTRPSSSRC